MVSKMILRHNLVSICVLVELFTIVRLNQIDDGTMGPDGYLVMALGPPDFENVKKFESIISNFSSTQLLATLSPFSSIWVLEAGLGQ